MSDHEDPPAEPADAISWLLLSCMCAAVIADLFLLLRIP
jgi:hypothetical protein